MFENCIYIFCCINYVKTTISFPGDIKFELQTNKHYFPNKHINFVRKGQLGDEASGQDSLTFTRCSLFVSCVFWRNGSFLVNRKGPWPFTKLVYNGFAYTSDGGSSEKRYWWCEFKSDNTKFPKCKGRAHTLANAVDGNPVFEKVVIIIYHQLRKWKQPKQQIVSNERAVETQEPAHKIVPIAIKTISEVTVPGLPPLSSRKRTIRHQRKGASGLTFIFLS